MKKAYEAPELDVIRFDTEDVITTSGHGKDSAGNEGESFIIP